MPPQTAARPAHTIISYRLKKRGRKKKAAGEELAFSLSDLHSSGSRDGGAVSSSIRLTSKKQAQSDIDRLSVFLASGVLDANALSSACAKREELLLFNYPGQT